MPALRYRRVLRYRSALRFSGLVCHGPRSPEPRRSLLRAASIRWLVAVVVEHRVDDGHDLLALGQAERLLPQPGLVVADDEEVRVVVPRRRVLPDLLQRRIDLLLRPGEEVPAGPGVHPAGVGLQLRRRVVGGIDRDRDEHQILAETVGVALLHRGYRSGEDRTARRTC